MMQASATWQTNPEHFGIEIKFPSKPSDEILSQLHQAGFKWHRSKKLWYTKDTPQARVLADKIAHFEGIKKCEYKNAKEGPKCRGLDQHSYDEPPNHELKPNDILYTSWGYDQTNVEWFRVYEIKGKRYFYIKEIGAKTVKGSEGHMSESLVPDPERILEGYPKKAYCSPKGQMHFSENNYQKSLYLWDGKPKYHSWYA